MDLNSSIDDDGTFSPIQFSFYHLAFGLELDMDLDRKVLEPDCVVFDQYLSQQILIKDVSPTLILGSCVVFYNYDC